ncbi:MAG: Bug family tripartite tricarboxylate transporter substrate binding protein [bacterium]|jgi:tripartite-type tricarboxylate transporter receptor subunit TctC|nr:tripartite tricarboxylate transporter substrate binding protein [Betaproteobacteria bacterium]
MIRLPARSFAAAAATTALALLPAGLLLPAGAAHAQAFPAKPVRFIVPFAAGSATDSVARLVGAFVTESTGQAVLVENRAGASGMIGAEAAARAPADGYTLLIGTNTTNAANASLFKSLPYNQQKDFAPVSLIGTAGLIAAVHPSLPVKSIAELTALAKKNPGKLNFGEGSASSRASVEMYKEMAGIDFLRVPYKSNPQAVTDLVSGQVVLMIADMVTLLPQVKAGKLRALAVSTPKRLAILPDLPTMSEAGVKGYELTVWFAGFVPSGTPAEPIRRMAELINGATKTPKMQEFFVNFGGAAQASTPDELGRFVASETAKWARIVKSAGIVPE